MYIVLTKLRNKKKVVVNTKSITYFEPFFGDEENTTIYFGATNAENPFQLIVQESMSEVLKAINEEETPSL